MLPARTASLVKVLTENAPSIPEKSAPQHTYKDDDIVIVSGLRSPITKAKRGGLKNLKADNLLAAVLTELMKRTPEVKMDRVGDMIVGNCLQPGGGQAMARIAMFEAGFPYSVPVASINRQCSSGLQSVASVAAHITNGDYSLAIAGGVESMSSCSFQGATPILDMKAAKANKHAADCMVPMGITSENVATAYGISRQEQDRYSLRSHRRAAAAQAAGSFAAEIAPVGAVALDDGVRPDTSMEALRGLKPAFVASNKGTTTAGNSSQVSDGAAAVVVASGRECKDLNLPALALWRAYSVVGVPPDVMGIGPAYAIPAVVRKAGLTFEDIDLYEINEAFASQVVFCVRFLGLREERVNPQGGAIALGHPLGCSGTRMLVTAAHYLQARNLRYAVVTMCVGTGMGAAALIENPAYNPHMKQQPQSQPHARARL